MWRGREPRSRRRRRMRRRRWKYWWMVMVRRIKVSCPWRRHHHRRRRRRRQYPPAQRSIPPPTNRYYPTSPPLHHPPPIISSITPHLMFPAPKVPIPSIYGHTYLSLHNNMATSFFGSRCELRLSVKGLPTGVGYGILGSEVVDGVGRGDGFEGERWWRGRCEVRGWVVGGGGFRWMGEFRVVMETGGGDGWKGVSRGDGDPGRDRCSFFGECKMHGVKRARGWGILE